MNKIIVFLFFFCAVCSIEAKTFYSNGPQNVKRVALTFDDGPGKATGKILDILKKKR